MKHLTASIRFHDKNYRVDFSRPIDLTIPIGRSSSPNAFYLPEPQYKTAEGGGFVGDVQRGGSCNVENISFSPHGNGTHTEGCGHISPAHHILIEEVKSIFALARVISLQLNDNQPVIDESGIKTVLPQNGEKAEAIVIRTLPNGQEKLKKNYSGTFPPYFTESCVRYLAAMGFRHLLVDLPSLDKEDDNKLKAHHAFFAPQGEWLRENTITEMVFVPAEVKDGLWWLDLQIAPFESDASPSRPMLFPIVAEET